MLYSDVSPCQSCHYTKSYQWCSILHSYVQQETLLAYVIVILFYFCQWIFRKLNCCFLFNSYLQNPVSLGNNIIMNKEECCNIQVIYSFLQFHIAMVEIVSAVLYCSTQLSQESSCSSNKKNCIT